jgi:aerobic carbon-monoxide dehydrogenase medium subunit
MGRQADPRAFACVCLASVPPLCDPGRSNTLSGGGNGMKAPDFAYERADDLGHALARLAELNGRARILAGGQSLVPTLNLRLQAPEVVLDISRIAVLRGISVAGSALRIGALTRHNDLLTSDLVALSCPLLKKAAGHIAHPAIRNRGTIGGSLALGDPAAELPACVVALDATIVVMSAGAERRIPARAFYTGVYSNVLEPTEMIVAVEIPFLKANERDGFLELSRREGDYAMVGVAARGAFANGAFSSLSLAYFAAGDKPVLAVGAAAVLTGKPLDAALADAAVKALGAELPDFKDLQADAAVRRHLAGVLLRRVLPQMIS